MPPSVFSLPEFVPTLPERTRQLYRLRWRVAIINRRSFCWIKHDLRRPTRRPRFDIGPAVSSGSESRPCPQHVSASLSSLQEVVLSFCKGSCAGAATMSASIHCLPEADWRKSIWEAPLGRKRFPAGGTMSDAAICPASYAAVGCGPVWEFADRNHFTQAYSMARGFRLVLPAPSRRLLCHTLRRPTSRPDSLWRRPRFTPQPSPEFGNPFLRQKGPDDAGHLFGHRHRHQHARLTRQHLFQPRSLPRAMSTCLMHD